MSDQACPSCWQPIHAELSSHPHPSGGDQWTAWCKKRSLLHKKSTVLIGTGRTREEAIESYVAAVHANRERAERLARIREEKAAGTYVEEARRVGKTEALHPSIVAGQVPTCPSCNVPLAFRVTKNRDKTIYVARCPNGLRARSTCEFGPTSCVHETEQGALSAWLFLIDRRKAEAKICGGKLGRRCRCGLRIADDAESCDDCIKPIHHYARSGGSASGIWVY